MLERRNHPLTAIFPGAHDSHARDRSHDVVARVLEHLHDVRLARPPQGPADETVAGRRAGQLGDRVLRVFAPGTGEPDQYGTLQLAQLKTLQEVITLGVFVPFAVAYMKQPVTLNFLWAALCLMGAVYFVFKT
jgi:hypothetical protein